MVYNFSALSELLQTRKGRFLKKGGRMESLKQAIQMAMKMEKDGADFYQEAATKVASESAKKMLLSFVKDEKKHFNLLKKIFEETKLPNFNRDFEEMFSLKLPADKVKTIFSKAKGEVQKHIPISSDELDVLRKAIEMEKKSVDFYQKQKGKAAEDKLRALFERLVEEERQHYQLLTNTLSYLEDSRDWYLWEEKALLNGG